MNGVPDGDAARHLRGRSTGQLLDGSQVGHIFNWNFNTQL